ncbi:RES family NAD+ phosphorylase [Nonomuraea typhae]|uniref:RES family NAD+ phosphorylase n=1 Tax=Nonomuraea typhae TaxID=2603600 RepID=UPI0012F8AF09|nr:RES family NAD+ phosphorylase [Nonomuraea typhae]
MPDENPPAGRGFVPHRVILPKGTPLWRVHSRKRPCEQFVDRLPRPGLAGGRFDGTAEDRYQHVYLAYEQSTALAEFLLRSVGFDGVGLRQLPHVTVTGKRLSLLETTREIALITLSSTPALAAVAQDEWLIQAQPLDYPRTRRWAHWLRAIDEDAAGLEWISRRNLPHRCLVLFRDRCGPAPLTPTPLHVDLDSESGLTWLNVILRPYRAYVTSPVADG